MSAIHPDKEVRIIMQDGIPVASPDPVVVKKDGQKLRWTADFDFKITVDDYTDLKHSGGGSAFECKSGHFPTERKHKYTISANGIDNDPTIDVKPDVTG
jgi:hypothetical protein